MAHNHDHKGHNHQGHNHTDHDHNHDEEHEDNNSGKAALSLAFWLNFLFSIIEVAGGIFTNSTAIIADAFHDFMDSLAIGIAILLEKISGKKRTHMFSYGYKRFSLLSALGMAIFLLIGAALMIVGAYISFIHGHEVNSVGMLWLAVLGIAINGFAFLRIKNGNGHGHSHAGHSHGNNHNSRGIMLHLLEDVLGWAAVLIGAIVIYFTGWNWIDGVLAIGIALYVGFNASKNLIATVKVLLQSVPENVEIKKLINELLQINGIEDVHDIHVWSLDGSYNVGSLHVVVNASTITNEHDILKTITILMRKHNIQHPTVQIETSIDGCELAYC